MPGLAGIINSSEKGPIDTDVLALLRMRLAHEHGYSLEQIKTVKSGKVVLIDPGVNDRLTGWAFDPASGTTAAFYGEFYNEGLPSAENGSETARRLIKLYREHGERFVERLNGSFVLFLDDGPGSFVMLANDHYASRPVFFSIQGGKLLFAPELKGVSCMPDADRTLNPLAFISFLINGHLLNDQTFFSRIHPMMPGSIITIRAGRLTMVQLYQNIRRSDSKDLGEAYYIDALSSLILRTVGKRLHSTQSLVIPLSGGYDSRGLVACVRQLTGEKVRTVTWGTDETTPGADGAVGRKISEYLGTDHHFLQRDSSRFVDDLDEMIYRTDGLNDDPGFHHNELSIIRKIRFELNAQYLMRGDHCFGFGGEVKSDPEALATIGVVGLEACPTLAGLLNPSLVEGFRSQMKGELRRMRDECKAEDPNDRKDYFYFTQRFLHYLNRSSYYKLTVLELQNPLMDRDILDFYKSVPWKYRLRKYIYKRTLKTMFPELFSLPFATAHSLESWGVLLRRSEDLQQYFRRHLLEERNGLHEFLDIDALGAYFYGSLKGSDQPGVKARALDRAKKAFQVSPPLYRLLKSVMFRFVQTKNLSSDQILFRLLIVKRWFDRFM